jgi:uncharacterized protein (TIGR02996 family)
VESNPALEQAIENNPDDKASYSVLADWLQSRGDPRGELIALSLAGNEDAAGGLLIKHGDVFLGDLQLFGQTFDGEDREAFTWRYGFIDSVRLSHNHYAAEDAEVDLANVLRKVLDHPSGRFVREIVFAFNDDPNEHNLQSLIDVLAEKPRPTLRRLHFGDFKYSGAARDEDRGDDTEISWYSVGNLAALWPRVPHLEKLIIQTGSAGSAMAGGTQLGEIALPELRHFEYRTGGLEQANGRSIVEMRAPALEHLDVWFGQDSYGGDAGLEVVETLLARTDLPKLRHLGIMNCELVNDLVPLLARSPLVFQLAELDLSLGALTDEGAHAIAENRAGFAKLAKLDVGYNYLSGEGIAAIGRIAKELVDHHQRSGDDHYSAVGE